MNNTLFLTQSFENHRDTIFKTNMGTDRHSRIKKQKINMPSKKEKVTNLTHSHISNTAHIFRN